MAAAPTKARVRRPLQLIWTNDLGQAGTVSFDAAVSEKHRLTSTVTDHPIEVGKNASDHIRPDPDELEFTGVITNTPIILPGNFADGARAIQVQVEGAPRTVGNTVGRAIPIVGALAARIPLPLPRQTATVLGFAPAFDRVGAVFQALRDLREDGSLVTAITTLRTYENMAIVSLEVERSAELGNTLQLVCALKEVRIGWTVATEVPAIPTERAEKGTKPPKPVETPPPVENESVAHKLFGSN